MDIRLPFGKRPFEFRKRGSEDDPESRDKTVERSNIPPSVIFVKKSEDEVAQIPIDPTVTRSNAVKRFQDPITSISDELLSLMHSSDEVFQHFTVSGHLLSSPDVREDESLPSQSAVDTRESDGQSQEFEQSMTAYSSDNASVRSVKDAGTESQSVHVPVLKEHIAPLSPMDESFLSTHPALFSTAPPSLTNPSPSYGSPATAQADSEYVHIAMDISVLEQSFEKPKFGLSLHTSGDAHTPTSSTSSISSTTSTAPSSRSSLSTPRPSNYHDTHTTTPPQLDASNASDIGVPSRYTLIAPIPLLRNGPMTAIPQDQADLATTAEVFGEEMEGEPNASTASGTARDYDSASSSSPVVSIIRPDVATTGTSGFAHFALTPSSRASSESTAAPDEPLDNMVQELSALESSILSEAVSQNASICESEVSFLRIFDDNGKVSTRESAGVQKKSTQFINVADEQKSVALEAEESPPEAAAWSIKTQNGNRAPLFVPQMTDNAASPPQSSSPRATFPITSPLDALSQDITSLVITPYDKARRRALREQQYIQKYPGLSLNSPKLGAGVSLLPAATGNKSSDCSFQPLSPHGSSTCSPLSAQNKGHSHEQISPLCHVVRPGTSYGRTLSPITLHSTTVCPTSPASLPLTDPQMRDERGENGAKPAYYFAGMRSPQISLGRVIEPIYLDRGDNGGRSNKPQDTCANRLSTQPYLVDKGDTTTLQGGGPCFHAEPSRHTPSTAASAHRSPSPGDSMNDISPRRSVSVGTHMIHNTGLTESSTGENARLHSRSFGGIPDVPGKSTHAIRERSRNESPRALSSSTKVTSRRRPRRKKMHNQDDGVGKVSSGSTGSPSALLLDPHERSKDLRTSNTMITDRRSLHSITVLRQKYASLYDDVQTALNSVEEHLSSLMTALHSSK